MERIAVFCGSKSGSKPIYADAARALGRALAEQQIELVYGGGSIGLMGVLADAVIAAGGRVIGIIPYGLAQKEVMHEGLSDLRLVRTMHERKAMMASLADGFMALPGGLGTMDEFFEILTWAQLGEHAKPIGILNTARFYDPLLAYLQNMVSEGFVKKSNLDLFITETDVSVLLDRLQIFRSIPAEPWIDASTT
ncbi:TIGR00730 family Rossman fold protein [bacterium]|nr:TIGR00730 family Rossman fold protein [bacterium]